MARLRADELLVARGLCDSVEQAVRVILAGDIVVDSPPLHSPLKAGTLLPDTAQVRRSRSARRGRFVSRGGDKLQGALRSFGYDPAGVRALDAGASTGGFTDCLLQNGASHVAAVDVGYGQLAWSLREDPRVSVFERTNIREVTPGQIGGPFELAVADLSFISLGKVSDAIAGCLVPDGTFIALVKPQFEAGQSEVGDRGVVESADVHRRVLEQAARDLAACGLRVTRLAYSPITGPEGNIEFWIESVVVEGRDAHGGAARAACGDAEGTGVSSASLDREIERVVREAHAAHRPSSEPKGSA